MNIRKNLGWVILMVIALILGILSGCTSKPSPEVFSTLTVTSGTNTTTYTTSCEEHQYNCNKIRIENSRTMYVGEDTYYICGLNSKLYMSRESYKAKSSLTEIEGTTCTYKVHVAKV